MSYLPYYIRPVASTNSAATTTTTSFTISRPTYSSTVTSPSTSLTSSARASPTRSVKDESFGTSPRASGLRRYERSNTSYIGYREDYIKKQADKNCGRKTLNERLKSLETEASVKLQVRKGARDRRRKSSERDFLAGLRSPNRSLLSPSSSIRSASQKLSESQVDSTPSATCSPSPPPPPDIIESYLPPSHTSVTPKDVEKKIEESSDTKKKSSSTKNISTRKSSSSTNEENAQAVCHDAILDIKNKDFRNPSSDEVVAIKTTFSFAEESNNKNYCSMKAEQPPSSQPSPNKIQYSFIAKETAIVDEVTTTICKTESKITPQEDVKPLPTSSSTSRHFNDKSCLLNDSQINLDTESIISCHQAVNAIKQQNTKNETFPEKKPFIEEKIKQQQNTKNETFTEGTSITEEHFSPPNIVNSSLIRAERETGEVENKIPEIIRPIPRREKPVVMDVTTDNAIIPVELRSPRSSEPRNGNSGRVNKREKRNARVFVFPSSDESESENILAKLNRYNRPSPVAPVKFYSTSASRNQSSPVAAKELSSQTSSSSSLPVDSKVTMPHEKATASNETIVPSRKSSRSPKRSSLKRSNRSKSSNDRSNTDKIKQHTRTLSSGSHTLASLSASSIDPPLRKSPDTPMRSGRSGSKGARISSNTRYKTEYTELTNSNRSTPRSPRDLEFTNLPSPRQLAVADAVKFGFSEGDSGAIPYIDEANTPEDQKTPLADVSLPVRTNEANEATIKRAFPLSVRRGRASRRKDDTRRTSYRVAVDGNAEEVDQCEDAKWFRHGIVFSDSDKEEVMASLGKLIRSNSADSVLSTSDAPNTVVMRKNPRSSSADRTSLKGVYRRSYQMATNQVSEGDFLNTSAEKSQASTKKLKSFFRDSSPFSTDGDDFRWGLRSRSIGFSPILTINRLEENIIKEGFLYFKVATIEKGKRTSSQKTWKLIWVLLKDRSLYLCKDWNRNKQESPSVSSFRPTGSPPSQLALEDEDPLNIQGSLVSIAYNYQKRKNVFRLTTSNGSEYLFQAEDREEMLRWISVIQIGGSHDNEEGEAIINEDLILWKTNQFESCPKQEKRSSKRSRSPKPARRGTNVAMKDVDGSRRFKWRGSVNRIVKKFGQGQSLLQGATFDVLLEDCPPSETNELVPFIVDLCCRLVEQHGLAFTGIYRVPGNTGTLQALQDELNLKGPEAVDLENDERFCDLNVVSSLLKLFFRKLPDPLFTNELYDDFIAMNRRKDPEERLSGLRRLIHMLPAPHYETLKYLINHLRKVSDNSEVNKMEIRNLAIVFGPTLVKNTATDNMATMVTDMSDQCRIVESVLQHGKWFFCEDEERAKLIFPNLSPSRVIHDEPNLDHLLANVGRTTDDISDTASESSKSKTSLVSDKESFSRDVMDSIFGSEKQWKINATQAEKYGETKKNSDDEDYDQITVGGPSPNASQSDSILSSTSEYSPQQHQLVGRQPVTATKLSRAFSKEHLPLDYNSRLREFFVENMEWLTRIDLNKSFPHLSSSSAESSPQVTPRTSMLGLPQPVVHRTFPRQHSRHLSDGKHSSQIVSPRSEHSRQVSTPLSSPLLQRNSCFQKDATFKTSSGGFWPSGNVFRDVRDNQSRSVLSSRSRSEVSSRESLMADVESDSDTSIFTGEYLDEKLKNLTNLNKKLERRATRRQGNGECPSMRLSTTASSPIKPFNKYLLPLNITDLDSFEYLQAFSKKSSQELYRERKAMRQQHRDKIKQRSNRKDCSDLSRCISDENVYTLTDPLHQCARTDVEIHSSFLHKRLCAGKSTRRHTLGSGDFPDPSFWESSHSTSLQNITRDIHDMTLSRLRPQLRASAPSLFPQTTNARFILYGVASPMIDWSRKPETHI